MDPPEAHLTEQAHLTRKETISGITKENWSGQTEESSSNLI